MNFFYWIILIIYILIYFFLSIFCPNIRQRILRAYRGLLYIFVITTSVMYIFRIPFDIGNFLILFLPTYIFYLDLVLTFDETREEER